MTPFFRLICRYAYDCQVMVDRYDHTCPWTGTAIGGGNMTYFTIFVTSVIVLIVLLLVLLAWNFAAKPMG